MARVAENYITFPLPLRDLGPSWGGSRNYPSCILAHAHWHSKLFGIPPPPPPPHTVLTVHYVDKPGHPTHDALLGVYDFLGKRLGRVAGGGAGGAAAAAAAVAPVMSAPSITPPPDKI